MMRLSVLVALSAILVAAVLATPAAVAKDQGPASAVCDRFEKTSAAWMDCAEATPAAAGPAVADAEHFYAGYWLAKNGRYEEALGHLMKARVKNARVLTYIGFATRKLGRVEEAMGYYREALLKDPQNAIARSYLGEAHLARDDLQSAIAELRRVEQSCGRNCEAFTELAARIDEYRASRGDRG